MRTAAPYQVNPRQLRALVLLLALLPLVPAAFVIRFLVEEMHNERSEARAHAKEVYQKFLSDTRPALAASAWRHIPVTRPGQAAEPWREIFAHAEPADAVLLVGDHGKLSLRRFPLRAPPAPRR